MRIAEASLYAHPYTHLSSTQTTEKVVGLAVGVESGAAGRTKSLERVRGDDGRAAPCPGFYRIVPEALLDEFERYLVVTSNRVAQLL
jgi:hypothetical protein